MIPPVKNFRAIHVFSYAYAWLRWLKTCAKTSPPGSSQLAIRPNSALVVARVLEHLDREHPVEALVRLPGVHVGGHDPHVRRRSRLDELALHP